MNIHIFNQETEYSDQYLTLLGEYFDINQHLIVFRRKLKPGRYDHLKIRDRILYIDNWFSFLTNLYPRLLRARTIFLHYLPLGPSLYFWFLFRGLLEKAVWVQWGNDLYFFQKEKKFPYNIYERIRKVIIPRIGNIACIPKEDFELTKKIYGTNANYIYAFYPNPITSYHQEDFCFADPKEKEQMNILLGNSANPTNNHKEVLDALARNSSGDRMKIFCPLSYAGNKSYVDEVIRKGKSLFGERFVSLLDKQPVNQYREFLSDMDLAIMNHRRKQGLGTVFYLLYLGKKVFIRQDVTSFNYLKRLGLSIYSTNDLIIDPDLDLAEFPKSLQEQNHRIIKEQFSFTKCASLWDKVFKTVNKKNH